MDGHNGFFHQAQSTLVRALQSDDDGKHPSPPKDCVTRLLELLAENHGRPMHEMSVAVRQIVFEHSEATYVRDTSCNPGLQRLSACAHRLVDELEKLRRAGVRRGMFSDAPVPPLMYGRAIDAVGKGIWPSRSLGGMLIVTPDPVSTRRATVEGEYAALGYESSGRQSLVSAGRNAP